MTRRPPRSTLFPSTTLFRSLFAERRVVDDQPSWRRRDGVFLGRRHAGQQEALGRRLKFQERGGVRIRGGPQDRGTGALQPELLGQGGARRPKEDAKIAVLRSRRDRRQDTLDLQRVARVFIGGLGLAFDF